MKKWFESKTFWFNDVTHIVVIASAILDQKLLTDPTAVIGFSLVITIGNAILRVVFTGKSNNGMPLSRNLTVTENTPPKCSIFFPQETSLVTFLVPARSVRKFDTNERIPVGGLALATR